MNKYYDVILDDRMLDHCTSLTWFYSRLHPKTLRDKGYNCTDEEAITLQLKTKEIMNILKRLRNA